METVDQAAEAYSKKVGYDGDYESETVTHFLAGAEWMRKQFGACAGTTDCIEPNCFNGRASFYTILDGRCIECAHRKRDAEGEHARD